MNEFLAGIIKGISDIVGNYGWAMIIFTILIRLVLTPFDVKSRVGMRRMTAVQPKVAVLQKKYANDKDKLNAKTAELYKKEKVNPLTSCLPLLLTWPILIAVFAAMRMVANEMMVDQVKAILDGTTVHLDGWLWVKNLWMPDNIFSPSLPDLSTLQQIEANIWTSRLFDADGVCVCQALAPLNLTTASFDKNTIAATLQSIIETMQTSGTVVFENGTVLPYLDAVAVMPGWKGAGFLGLFNFEVKSHWNGLLLLPVLSAASQLLMTKITGGQEQQPADPNQPNSGKFMKWFFPIFSMVICLGYSAAFALYWVAGNLVSMVQTVVINKVLDNKEKKQLANAAEGSVK